MNPKTKALKSVSGQMAKKPILQLTLKQKPNLYITPKPATPPIIAPVRNLA